MTLPFFDSRIAVTRRRGGCSLSLFTMANPTRESRKMGAKRRATNALSEEGILERSRGSLPLSFALPAHSPAARRAKEAHKTGAAQCYGKKTHQIASTVITARERNVATGSKLWVKKKKRLVTSAPTTRARAHSPFCALAVCCLWISSHDTITQGVNAFQKRMRATHDGWQEAYGKGMVPGHPVRIRVRGYCGGGVHFRRWVMTPLPLASLSSFCFLFFLAVHHAAPHKEKKKPDIPPAPPHAAPFHFSSRPIQAYRREAR